MRIKSLLCLIFLATFFLTTHSVTFAESSYVLPYPPQMPGSFMYKLRLVSEEIQKYWYFGNFGQFKYNLKKADKYLVEAKTLFDYKQYLLAYNALKKSDLYFSKTFPYLKKAAKEGKDIAQNYLILRDASLKHIEVLEAFRVTLPETFTWQEEKTTAKPLHIGKEISQSIAIRNKSL